MRSACPARDACRCYPQGKYDGTPHDDRIPRLDEDGGKPIFICDQDTMERCNETFLRDQLGKTVSTV